MYIHVFFLHADMFHNDRKMSEEQEVSKERRK